jgi:hypothetical protein
MAGAVLRERPLRLECGLHLRGGGCVVVGGDSRRGARRGSREGRGGGALRRRTPSPSP